MSKLSKTAAASMRGIPGEVKKDPFDTNEKKIHELRIQRTNKLAVVRYDFIDALIEAYDATKILNISLLKQVADAGDELNKVLLTNDQLKEQSKTDLFVLRQVSAARDEIVAERHSLLEQLAELRRTLNEAANTKDGNYSA